MKKLFLSAGHSTVTDKGTVGLDGVNEGDLTAELRKLLVKELAIIGVYPQVDPDENATGTTVKTITSHIKHIDVAIDLHFNAYIHPKATGSEALVPFSHTTYEVKLAKALSATCSNVLSIVDRGVKTEANSARGRLIFMRPNCENVLLEVCFITNKEDYASYLANKTTLAKELAKTIYSNLI